MRSQRDHGCTLASLPTLGSTPEASTDRRRRIGFLYNHDQVHQVAHSLPIALTLARRNPSIEVVLAYTNERLKQEILRLAPPRDLALVTLVCLPLRSSLVQASVRALNVLIPAAKLAIYRENLPFFASLDTLVVAEKTSAVLRTRYGLDRLRLVHTRHGAGDRAVVFNAASAQFDLVLASGPKVRDRLVQDAGLDPATTVVVGYPKFDISRPPATLKFSGNGRKTVLYNPHCSPHLSSWFREGRAVLDYFASSQDYNLIFAPHVMLFERSVMIAIDKLSLNFPGKIADKYRRAPNIHLDLGSAASTDMSYTNAADIYLGDVSSQIYEFLRTPRPCLFLNAHNAAWRSDESYRHWTFGPVVDEEGDVMPGLERACETHADYRAAQVEGFRYTFDLAGPSSSARAAEAIARLALAASARAH